VRGVAYEYVFDAFSSGALAVWKFIKGNAGVMQTEPLRPSWSVSSPDEEIRKQEAIKKRQDEKYGRTSD
jgi:hypothetical protein